MNINTNKLASNSNHFLKKLKEANGSSKKDGLAKENFFSDKLMNDFFDIKSDTQSFKARIINNNLRLSRYESEMTELQFVNEKINEITNLLQNGENDEVITGIIKDSVYDDKPVLKELFPSGADLQQQIETIRAANSQRKTELDKEFKAIQIATQNIISLNSSITAFEKSDSIIGDMKFEDAVRSSTLDNRRVMDLIS